MKNNFSKILITIFAMVTLLCAFAMVANAAVVEEGTTDVGFKWAITDDAGYVLTISDTETSKSLDVLTFPSTAPWSGKYSFAKVVIEADVKTIGSSEGVLNVCRAPVLVIPKSVTKLYDNFYNWNTSLHSILVLGETYSASLGECIVDFRNLSAFPSKIQYSFDYAKDITFLFPKFGWIGGLGNFGVIHKSQTDNLGNGYHIGEGDVFYVESDWNLRSSLESIAEKIGFTVKAYPKAMTNTAMEMHGYQVRTEDYNGLRGIFNFNENIVNEGYSLIEYGAILATDANRGENDANIKLSYNEETGEYEPTVERIVKKAIKKNGALVPGAKTLKKLNGQAVGDIEGYGEGYTWFATTLVNFTHSYKSDVYMCGYEIWKNEFTGETNIIYTSYEYPEYESASIYDVSIELIADGFTNDLENNPVGSVVKAAGAVTLTSTDAILPTGAESLVAENIEMKGYSGGAFTDGTTYYSLYELADGNYLAYISGAGNLNAAALKTTYASDYAGEARPVPTLLAAAHNKITHMVVGEGIVDISAFNSMAKLVSIIYPKSLTSFGTAIKNKTFQYSSALEKIVPVGSMTDEKIFEFGGIGGFDNYNMQWTFQNCSAVEYIHLNGYRGGTDSFYGCKSLKAIWIGDAERPADGIADLRNCSATKLYMGSFTNTSKLDTLLLSDTFTTLAKSTYGFTTTTIYQATANDTIATFCASGDPKTVATYTQTLPN